MDTDEFVQRAWDHWNALGAPKFHVAPMVDQSELPFRMLCRRYGADAAYSPMLHSRLFADFPLYREDVFSTCPEDRPLFIQFCGNDPDVLLRAAKLVENMCDYVDLNTGCPQRIAKKGHYGAFLMDEWDLLERLITTLAKGLKTPVSVKIRIFPDVNKTVQYAKMFQRAGASVVAVHGRTREVKNPRWCLADWDQIRAVKAALRVPVIANGNVRHVADALECLRYTGCDAIMSAESLLEDPALFGRPLPGPGEPVPSTSGPADPLERVRLAREYLLETKKHPVPFRMVRGHVWSILGAWVHEFTQFRDEINAQGKSADRIDRLLDLVGQLEGEVGRIVREEGRTEPRPKATKRELEEMQKREALERAIEEQEREEQGLEDIERRQAKASVQALEEDEDECWGGCDVFDEAIMHVISG